MSDTLLARLDAGGIDQTERHTSFSAPSCGSTNEPQCRGRSGMAALEDAIAFGAVAARQQTFFSVCTSRSAKHRVRVRAQTAELVCFV